MQKLARPTPKVALKRARRRVREREKRHRRRGGRRRWKLARARFTATLFRLFAPSEIRIDTGISRRATLQFCRRLRQAYLQDGRSVILDFSATRKIIAAGMLVIVAEVDRCQRMGQSNQRFVCKLPDDVCDQTKIVRQVLDQIDLLERLDHPKIHSDKSEFHSTVRHWRYATGTRVDEESGDVLEQHQDRIAPLVMEKMQIGLTEAITNSIHHAYKSNRGDGCGVFKEHRWWMFTHEADGKLNVLVCDLGIGISRSLPLDWSRDLLRKLTAYFPGDHEDVAAIQMALLLGRTSTDDENRGKGLPQIWNAVHESDVGGVSIYSGRGLLTYTAETERESQGAYDTPFLGTLISWQVAIHDSARVPDGQFSDQHR